MQTPAPRTGFTILELMVVLAMLVLLASLTLPSFDAMRGNSRQKAAADLVRTRIALARARAMETGVPQRLAISADGTKIRLAPDDAQFASAPADRNGVASASANEDLLDKATAALHADEGAPTAFSDGTWTTIATFKPDGTCKEDNVIVKLHEGTFPPLRIQIRGVTGTARMLSPQTSEEAGQ